MAMIVPILLWIICHRASSAITPRATITSLSTPCDCRIAIQVVVRTSNEVQNGSRTRIISRLE